LACARHTSSYIVSAELLYYDYQDLPAEASKKVGARRIEDLKEFLGCV